MQSVSSRIWTRVGLSISYDDNHYTMGTSKHKLIIIIIIIIIIIPGEFFTSALTNGLSLKFEWLQISLSLQDFSQYSGRCWQCCSVDGLDSSSDFQSPFQAFNFCSKCANYNWYHCHPHLWRGPSTCLSFCFLWFSLYGPLRR